MTYVVTVNPGNTDCDSGNADDSGNGTDGGGNDNPNIISFCSSNNLAADGSFQNFNLYPNPVDNNQPLTIEFTGISDVQ